LQPDAPLHYNRIIKGEEKWKSKSIYGPSCSPPPAQWSWARSKAVLGEIWSKLAKVDLGSNKVKAGAGRAIGITIVVSFLTAYVLAHVTYLSHQFFHNSFLQDALSTAFWMWLGFTAARIITHDVFEQRPAKLTLITIAHELITLLVMGFVIGLMGT
jgi:hypothetical protein